MSEQNEIRENRDNRDGSVVTQLDTVEAVSTRHELMAQDSDALKSVSPLLYSMRLFGLYFARKPQVSPISANNLTCQGSKGHRDWNAGRIYATVLLVIVWIGTLRWYLLFDGTETLRDVSIKLMSLSTGVFVAVEQTAYYVASHTGSLDRVFRQVDISISNSFSKYSRRAKAVTVVCWILMTSNVVGYISFFPVGDKTNVNDASIRAIVETYNLSGVDKGLITAAVIIQQIQSIGALVLPQAMNFMVTMLLYDQFNNLNAEFSRCVGDGGEFSGNFEQFRRRHQAISRSVNEADCFIKISNVACFFCQIVSVIFVLYDVIFYRHETVSIGGETAMIYVVWLLICVTGLSLTAGLAVAVNHSVSRSLMRVMIYAVSIDQFYKICGFFFDV